MLDKIKNKSKEKRSKIIVLKQKEELLDWGKKLK